MEKNGKYHSLQSKVNELSNILTRHEAQREIKSKSIEEEKETVKTVTLQLDQASDTSYKYNYNTHIVLVEEISSADESII